MFLYTGDTHCKNVSSNYTEHFRVTF